MNFIYSMLSDGVNGTVSSKRVVTLLAFILCCIAFIADLFWDKTITQAIYDSMTYIVIAGLGFTASEKFSSSRTNKYKTGSQE
jgi:hypothetical protein